MWLPRPRGRGRGEGESLAGSRCSDHVALLNAFQAWEEARWVGVSASPPGERGGASTDSARDCLSVHVPDDLHIH